MKTYAIGSVEAKLDVLVPKEFELVGTNYALQFSEIKILDDGDWSSLRSWVAFPQCTREQAIERLAARWEEIKSDVLPNATVGDLYESFEMMHSSQGSVTDISIGFFGVPFCRIRATYCRK